MRRNIPTANSTTRDQDVKSIRVLMVVRLFFPWVGGSERQALRLAKKLVEKGVDVKIVTGWWFPGTPQRDLIEGIPVYRNQTLWEMFGIKGLRKLGGFLYMFTLFMYLARNRNNFDILHVHGLNYHTYVAVKAGKWFKRKTITKLVNSGTASDIIKMRNNQLLAFSRYMLPSALTCDHFIALTKTISNELVLAGVQPERITELVNGIEAGEIIPKSSYELHNPPQLIFVGRLHEQKGLDILIKAIHQIVEHKPMDNLILKVVGSGPLWDEVHRLVDNLNISRYVQFMGHSDKVLEHLQQSDIFVLPSRAEGISNALLEAMACGLPVVVSDIPGNTNLVKRNQNGVVFTGEDPASLAESLSLLLSQTELRQKVGLSARQTVETFFSLDYVADKYIDLYRGLLPSTTDPQNKLSWSRK